MLKASDVDGSPFTVESESGKLFSSALPRCDFYGESKASKAPTLINN